MTEMPPSISDYRPPFLKREGSFILAASILYLLMSWAMATFGQHQFGGNDTGVLVDDAYRLYYGYHPYVDFPITRPILYYLGCLWSMQLFGVTWTALIDITILFCGLTYVLHLVLLRRLGISKVWSIATAATIQIGSFLPSSYWWYNSSSDVAVCLYCTAALLVLAKPSDRVNWILYCVTLFIASLAKANMAGPAIVACSVALELRKETRIKAIVYSLIAAFCSAILLCVYRLNPLDVLHHYFAAAGRGVPVLDRFVNGWPLDVAVWQVATPVVMMLPILAVLIKRMMVGGRWRFDVPRSIILGSGIFVGELAAFTNGDVRTTDQSLVLMCGILFFLLPISDKRGLTNGFPMFLQRFAITFMVSLSVWMCVTRFKVWTIGPFFQSGPEIAVGERNAFYGKMKASPEFIGILEDITSFLADRRAKMAQKPELEFNRANGSLIYRTEPKVFFGPRMVWAYAAFHVEPPRVLPMSWWAGVDYPADQVPAMADYLKNAGFDYLIFYSPGPNNLDLTYMPPEVVQIVFNDFKIVGRARSLIVFAKK